ncbi:MAG: antibiotic biosynthesis monooxygenase [Pseudomonadota bacterium]
MIDNDSGATAVITHRVREVQHEEYEAWLQQILPLVSAARGFLDVQVIRPVRGLTSTYTVILRFDCEADLRYWITSPQRQKMIATVTPILAHGDTYTVHSGIDFLFAPQDGTPRVPVRWKQLLITWSAIFPLTCVLPLVAGPLLQRIGLDNHYVLVAIVSGLAVTLMVYVIMPRYTRLVRHWLYR